MSVAPYYPGPPLDPRYLPQTAGPSTYADSQRFVGCPANWQPWGTLHERPVFLPIRVCDSKSKRAQERFNKTNRQMFYVNCPACKFRAFFAGDYWVGVTRYEIANAYGHGVAVDDFNCYF